MKKYCSLLVALFLLTINSLLAQKEVAVLDTEYKSEFLGNKESLAISNSITGDLIILVEDKKKTNIFLLGKDFKVKKKLETPSLLKSFKSFMGYHINDNSLVTIFFTNIAQKKFGVLELNFDQDNVEQNILDLKFKGEKIIEGITHNNQFYILTGVKKSNFVNFYKYNSNGKAFDKKEVSFESINYTSEKGFKKDPLSLMRTSFFGSSFTTLKKIDSNSPNAIETTASKSKLYQIKDSLIFSFDHNQDKSQFISVNTNDFSAKSYSFDKPNLDYKDSEIRAFEHHNSYLYKGVVYQMKISHKQMKFIAKSYLDKKVLKEITLNKEDSITFKNGPIIQEGGSGSFSAGRIRELEKTSKFLRKVAKGDTGISVFNYGDLTQVSIGSYLEVTNTGAAFAGGMAGGVIGGAIAGAAFSFNPTYAAYGSYTSTKSTYIDCVFDENFKHVKGDRIKNVFDVIEDYEDDFYEAQKKPEGNVINKKKVGNNFGSVAIRLRLKNIFYHRGKTYFAFLNVSDKQYHILEFE